jgi:hypothetical protein
MERKELKLLDRPEKLLPNGNEIRVMQMDLTRLKPNKPWLLEIVFGAHLTGAPVSPREARTCTMLNELKTETDLPVIARSLGVRFSDSHVRETVDIWAKNLHKSVIAYVTLGLIGLRQIKLGPQQINDLCEKLARRFPSSSNVKAAEQLIQNQVDRGYFPYIDLSQNGFQPCFPRTIGEMIWFKCTRKDENPVLSPLGDEERTRLVSVDRGAKCVYTLLVNNGHVQNGLSIVRQYGNRFYTKVCEREAVHSNHHGILCASNVVNDPILDWRILPKSSGREMIKAIAFGEADRKLRHRLAITQKTSGQIPIFLCVPEGFGTGTCPGCANWIPQIGSKDQYYCSECKKNFDRDPAGAINARKNLTLVTISVFGGPSLSKKVKEVTLPAKTDNSKNEIENKRKKRESPNTEKGQKRKQENTKDKNNNKKQKTEKQGKRKAAEQTRAQSQSKAQIRQRTRKVQPHARTVPAQRRTNKHRKKHQPNRCRQTREKHNHSNKAWPAISLVTPVHSSIFPGKTFPWTTYTGRPPGPLTAVA